jgi:hypothetical protein
MKIAEKLYWLVNGMNVFALEMAIINGNRTQCAVLGAVVMLTVFIEFVKWAAPRSVR